MDDIVKAALAKWPHVPDCVGWLALDARGDWYMRDDRTQAAGPFPEVKGSKIVHDKLREFIARNYEADGSGCWFFQNGPQRVFVELEAAPWVWRLHREPSGNLCCKSHTGQAAVVRQACLDEQGRVFAQTSLGFGLVHSQDVALAADEIETGRWALRELPFGQMPAEFGYCLSPEATRAG
ncbi:MAG: DUF2946 domain-containing protein [Ideonella sp. MAG2]|nr:MAG: DUF2946 domain-containing protein [Ideonella sp. MAG2]